MQINGEYLLPQMSLKNTGTAGTNVLNDEASFQAQLQAATDKLEKTSSTEIKTMTDEEIEERNKEIKDASVQLEAIMLKLMYNEMWKTVPKDKLFGDDNAMDIYRDMYHEELTKAAAEGGGIGLADFIYQQLAQTK